VAKRAGLGDDIQHLGRCAASGDFWRISAVTQPWRSGAYAYHKGVSSVPADPITKPKIKDEIKVERPRLHKVILSM